MRRLLTTITLLYGCFLSVAAQTIGVSLRHRNADSTLTTRAALGVASYTDSLKGVQVSVFNNIAASPIKGIQLSPIANIAMGVDHGLQMGGVVNVSSGMMRGIQVGGYNYADTLTGIQVGLINVSQSNSKGWQVGLINYTKNIHSHRWGLINVNPNTRIDLLLGAGTSTKFYAALRFRNRSTYNIIGLGTHYLGLDHRFSGAAFYRIGQYFSLSPRLSLSGDVGFAHVETFEHGQDATPDHLYSLQARANIDYQITRNLGAFATIGYDHTRYYGGRLYANRFVIGAGISLKYGRRSQQRTLGDRLREQMGLDTISIMPPLKRPWIAALEVVGINAVVHSFDRFVMQEDFAKVNFTTIGNNFKHAFVWDNDQFSTNLFAHPYHGSLYFNAARSNGMNFWQSAPYALGGSAMWEFFGEKEPPALNDLIATTIGGIAIGEVTHRISNIILNNRSHGFRRFLREAAATIIDPMKGFNRIVSGQAWRIDNEHPLYHDRKEIPLDFSISLGNRYLANEGAFFRGENNPYINFYLDYGNVLNEHNLNKPYDFFSLETTFGLSKNQPLINNLQLLGRLWSTPMIENKKARGTFGFYQHFEYYDSRPVRDGSTLTPYRISEAASLGPGFVIAMPQVGSVLKLEERFFISGILLGGTKSDYYNIIDRDYNMGSGYSIKSKTFMEMRSLGRFILNAKLFHLFTWKGYENKDLATIDPLYLNAQGDRGSALLFVLNPMFEFDLRNGVSFNLSGSYFGRHTHYAYHPNVRAQTYEIKAGFTVHL